MATSLYTLLIPDNGSCDTMVKSAPLIIKKLRDSRNGYRIVS